MNKTDNSSIIHSYFYSN